MSDEATFWLDYFGCPGTRMSECLNFRSECEKTEKDLPVGETRWTDSGLFAGERICASCPKPLKLRGGWEVGRKGAISLSILAFCRFGVSEWLPHRAAIQRAGIAFIA